LAGGDRRGNHVATASAVMFQGDRYATGGDFAAALGSYQEADRQLSTVRQKAGQFAAQLGVKSEPFNQAKQKLEQCQLSRQFAMAVIGGRKLWSQAQTQAASGNIDQAMTTLGLWPTSGEICRRRENGRAVGVDVEISRRKP